MYRSPSDSPSCSVNHASIALLASSIGDYINFELVSLLKRPAARASTTTNAPWASISSMSFAINSRISSLEENRHDEKEIDVIYGTLGSTHQSVIWIYICSMRPCLRNLGYLSHCTYFDRLITTFKLLGCILHQGLSMRTENPHLSPLFCFDQHPCRLLCLCALRHFHSHLHSHGEVRLHPSRPLRSHPSC